MLHDTGEPGGERNNFTITGRRREKKTIMYVDLGRRIVAKQTFTSVAGDAEDASSPPRGGPGHAGTPIGLADYVSRLHAELSTLDAAAATASATLTAHAQLLETAHADTTAAHESLTAANAALETSLSEEWQLETAIRQAAATLEKRRAALRKAVDEVAQLRHEVATKSALQQARATAASEAVASTMSAKAALDVELKRAQLAAKEAWESVIAAPTPRRTRQTALVTTPSRTAKSLAASGSLRATKATSLSTARSPRQVRATAGGADRTTSSHADPRATVVSVSLTTRGTGETSMKPQSYAALHVSKASASHLSDS
jgi:hypothetical protein